MNYEYYLALTTEGTYQLIKHATHNDLGISVNKILKKYDEEIIYTFKIGEDETAEWISNWCSVYNM